MHSGHSRAPRSPLEVCVHNESRYPVVGEPGLLARFGRLLAATVGACNLAVISDERVFGLYGATLERSLRDAGYDPCVLLVPEGEGSKSLETFTDLLGRLIEAGLDRRGLLLAFGGGVTSDLGGFVASAYMRGIRYANFATSLIGQLDASVGGKVAVNLPQAKNIVGAFHHPSLVAYDTRLLHTLDERDLRSGIAEAIKVAIIQAPDLFDLLERRREEVRARDEHVLDRVVRRAIEAKMELVSLDPLERDLDRPLNFGHTLGHPIEIAFAYRGVRHGEAVAVGMAVATFIARRRGTIGEDDAERILALLSAYDLVGCTPPIDPSRVLEGLRCVRLIRAGRLRFVLPRAVGAVEITESVAEEEIASGFAEYTSFASSCAGGGGESP